MKDALENTRPPWTGAAAALIAFFTLALVSGADLSLVGLGIGLLASYAFQARFENVTLTKWTLRILVIGAAVFAYLATAARDPNGLFDPRYWYSFSLICAGELVLQYWRREPTGGVRAPLTVFLSALVFLFGCNTFDENHRVVFLAPAYFLFLALSLPGFRPASLSPTARRLAAGFAVFALLLGIGSHLAIYVYRGQITQWGAQLILGKRSSPTMGMTGQPLLGPTFALRGSLNRVLRIENMRGDPYLRGMTFETYAGHGWGPGLEQRRSLPISPNVFLPNAPGFRARFTRLDDSLNILFAPLESAGLSPEGIHSLQWAQETDGPLQTEAADTNPLTYDVVQSATQTVQGPFNKAPSFTEQEKYLRVPADIDARVFQKAQQIGQGLTSPTAKISAVQAFLIRNHKYSLTTDPGPGDPVSNFILSHKAAHCEYFASAAVILLRCLGVPTRYVSGYYAHESGGHGIIIVRQRDAHAWAESFIAGQGWINVDATPGDGRPDQEAGPVPLYWQLWEWFQDRLAAIRDWLVNSSLSQKGVVFAAMAAILIVPQLWRWWARRRQAGGTFHYSSSDAEMAALAARFDRLLKQRKVICPVGRTWAEHLPDISQSSPTPLLEVFVHDYSQFRFGSSPAPENIAALRELLGKIEKETA